MGDWEALLARIPMFQQLNAADREALAEQVSLIHLGSGRVLFEMGEPGDSAYIVHQGQIRIYLTDASGATITLATLGPGEIFGEISLLDGGPRTASASAVGDTELLMLDRQDLLEFLIRRPMASLALLTVMGRRLRDTNQRFSSQAKSTKGSLGSAIQPFDVLTRMLASPLALILPMILFAWWLIGASEAKSGELMAFVPLMGAATLAVFQLTLLMRLVILREQAANRVATGAEEVLLRIESGLNQLRKELPDKALAQTEAKRSLSIPTQAGMRST